MPIEKDGGRHRSSERVLELIDGFQKRNGDQTNRDGGHGQNAQQFVRDDSQRVESREKVPLRKISNGVGLTIRSRTAVGSITAKETHNAMVPKMTTGKMYNKSFGHAGSP